MPLCSRCSAPQAREDARVRVDAEEDGGAVPGADGRGLGGRRAARRVRELG